jgi:hypothetical protein
MIFHRLLIAFFASALFASAQTPVGPRDERAFPTAANKKGLQVQMLDDALALGIHHAALNVSLGALIDLDKKPGNPTWQVEGQTYSFRLKYLESLGVKRLSDAKVNVYLILLAYESGRPEMDNLLLHPARAAKLPNQMAAVNTVTPEGARLWRATVEFLADWFCRADDAHGRAVGFIIGNEVNVHHEWNNFGKMPREQAVTDYYRVVKLAHTAVRTRSATARVYLSFTHHWTLDPMSDPLDALPAKTFIDDFARLARADGDFDWHVAYHPYPEDLGNPRTWEDKTAQPSFDSPRITFKNLDQLDAYFRRPELLCKGARRSIILSEQGFHSNGKPDSKRGEIAQAAGYCYAWEKVARLDGIDAFILHRHVDHKLEGGLNLGLWRRQPESVATPSTTKPIYDCFKAAGTPEQAKAFEFALPIVGLKNWDDLGPKKEPARK